MYQSVKFNDSTMIFAVPNEMTLQRVKTFWNKEPDTLRWIATFKPDDLFIDIGANMGLYSLYAACSRGVNVIAFEPESLNYALLNQNIFLNRMDAKIKAYSLALSHEIAFDTFHVNQFEAGFSCHNFKDKLDFKHEPMEPVFSQGCFSLTLDYLVQGRFLPVPQHIKIDVDGIEHQILQGAKNILQRKELQSVLVELNTKLKAHLEVIEMMQMNGFSFSERRHVDDGPFQGISNYIFFREPESLWEQCFLYSGSTS